MVSVFFPSWLNIYTFFEHVPIQEYEIWENNKQSITMGSTRCRRFAQTHGNPVVRNSIEWRVLAESGLSFWGNSIGLNDRFWEKQTFRFWLSKYRCRATGIRLLADLELIRWWGAADDPKRTSALNRQSPDFGIQWLFGASTGQHQPFYKLFTFLWDVLL